jgi:hypothetical protein
MKKYTSHLATISSLFPKLLYLRIKVVIKFTLSIDYNIYLSNKKHIYLYYIDISVDDQMKST